MKRILTNPLSGAQPGVRRAYERLRRAMGASTGFAGGAEGRVEGGIAPLPEPIPMSAVPARLLELESRMLLRFVLRDEPEISAIDSSFELASRFTRHGATILDLQEIDHGVFVEFLLTVEQAMFILGHTPAAPVVLERWLRGAGYRDDLLERIEALTAALRERYAPAAPTTDQLPALPLAAMPADPSDWN